MSPYQSSSPENPARRINGKSTSVGRQAPAMKTRIFRTLALCALLLAACETAAAQGRAETVSFAASKGLGDFEFAVTGSGAPGEWSVVRDDATQALAQTSTDPTDDRFPLAIYRPFSGRNVYVSVRFMPVSGNIDRAGGVVLRLTSAGDYYLARANALENNVRFYRVVQGKRQMIAGVDAPVASGAWHTLGIAARDDRFIILFNGRELFGASDPTLPGPGRVGMWTKADSVTWFESIKIKSLE
jgi:predicted small secreted protein